MKRAVLFALLVLRMALPAAAQSAPSARGSFAVDAMIAPTTGLGFGYYVTDGLSLRPWLGLGYSNYQGFFANVGAQLRYEFAAGRALAPYLSASAQYSHTDSGAIAAPPPGRGQTNDQQVVIQGDGGQFGAGAGLRLRVATSLALFAEGRVLRTTYPIGGLKQGWSAFGVDDHTRGEVVLGASYLFH